MLKEIDLAGQSIDDAYLRLPGLNCAALRVYIWARLGKTVARIPAHRGMLSRRLAQPRPVGWNQVLARLRGSIVPPFRPLPAAIEWASVNHRGQDMFSRSAHDTSTHPGHSEWKLQAFSRRGRPPEMSMDGCRQRQGWPLRDCPRPGLPARDLHTPDLAPPPAAVHDHTHSLDPLDNAGVDDLRAGVILEGGGHPRVAGGLCHAPGRRWRGAIDVIHPTRKPPPGSARIAVVESDWHPGGARECGVHVLNVGSHIETHQAVVLDAAGQCDGANGLSRIVARGSHAQDTQWLATGRHGCSGDDGQAGCVASGCVTVGQPIGGPLAENYAGLDLDDWATGNTGWENLALNTAIARPIVLSKDGRSAHAGDHQSSGDACQTEEHGMGFHSVLGE